jgi:hypothetical protein
MASETITLTFGDCAENHRGMQSMGQMAAAGITNEELEQIKTHIESISNLECELIDLDQIPITNQNPYINHILPPAKLLIIRNGIKLFGESGSDSDISARLYEEQCEFERDKKAFMYGRVVNKKARHNLCFSDFDQDPDYISGKGTVINFTRTPILNKIRNELPAIMQCGKLAGLQCEANYYYDIDKTYIGFHGDTERRIVVGLRLGAKFPLHYQWYYQHQSVSNLETILLNDGDIYIMSDKAVGYDWKHGSRYTLRHAAGLIKNISK